MQTQNFDRIGSRIALFIGLPFGTIFSLTVLLISLFPPIDIALAFHGGAIFWHPIIWAGLIPVTFIFLLWKAGGKIKVNLDKKHSILKTSFFFTLFINSWLFALIILIFIIGGTFFSPSQATNLLNMRMTMIYITIFSYIISTVFTTFTIGYLIISITQKKLNNSYVY